MKLLIILTVLLVSQDSANLIDTRQRTQRELLTPFGRVLFVSPRDNSERLISLTLEAMKACRRFLAKHGVNLYEDDISINLFDESVEKLAIPSWLKRSCHPGWVEGGRKITIVKKRVENCMVQDFNTSLKRVLIHELGHIILFRLRPDLSSELDIQEGFATWFEYQVLGDKPKIPQHLCQNKNFSFTPSEEGYLLSSMMFWGLTAYEVFTKLKNADPQELRGGFSKGFLKFCSSY